MRKAEVARSPGQHIHRSVVIQPLDVVQAHADLQDALIETPHITTFLTPQVFQGFMLREEVAAVELRDTAQQQPRRWLVTPSRPSPGL